MTAKAADVTVLITSHNELPYLPQALDSVLKQTAAHRIARVIGIDDRSSDGGQDWWAARAREEAKVQFLPVEAYGVAAARNAGLALVDTPFVAFLDGDDFWSPDKLEAQLATLERTGADLAYSDFVDFSHAPEAGARILVRHYAVDTRKLSRKYFIWDAPIVPSSVLLRMDWVRKLGGFDPTIKLFEDTDYFWRLAFAGARFQHCRRALTYKRRRDGSMSADVERWRLGSDTVAVRAIALDPSLKRHLRRRQGFRLAKIADGQFRAGAEAAGWKALAQAAALNPRNPRLYLYLLSALMPRRARTQILTRAKRMWAAIGARPA